MMTMMMMMKGGLSEVYADDCVGADELIICARPVSPPVKLPFNPYATSSKRRGLGAAGEE